MESFGFDRGGRSHAGGLALILAVAAALSAVLLAAAGCGGEDRTATTSDPGGRLQIAETYHDFGSVPVGEKVEYQFTLHNSGSGPLNLGQMEVKRLEGC